MFSFFFFLLWNTALIFTLHFRKIELIFTCVEYSVNLYMVSHEFLLTFYAILIVVVNVRMKVT